MDNNDTERKRLGDESLYKITMEDIQSCKGSGNIGKYPQKRSQPRNVEKKKREKGLVEKDNLSHSGWRKIRGNMLFYNWNIILYGRQGKMGKSRWKSSEKDFFYEPKGYQKIENAGFMIGQDVEGFKIIHCSKYEIGHKEFLLVQKHMDIESVKEISIMYPGHLESIIVQYECHRMEERHDEAFNIINRGVFLLNQQKGARFDYKNPEHIMDYRYYPNRAMFLMLFYYSQGLKNLSAWESCYEYLRMVLLLGGSGLRPERNEIIDPLGIRYILDFYALKARRWDYFEEEKNKEYRSIFFEGYESPGYLYSKAMGCIAPDGVEEHGFIVLIKAIQAYPLTLLYIYDELKSGYPEKLRDLQIFKNIPANHRTEMMNIVQILYARISAPHWSTGANAVLLKEVVSYLIEVDPEISQERTMGDIDFDNIDKAQPILRISGLMDIQNPTSETYGDFILTDPYPPMGSDYGPYKDFIYAH